MISRISIKNYAIIDSLEIEFSNNFNIFTGETGAGKSIIVGAINLLLGEKSDSSMIRTGEEKAIIEAEFVINNNNIKQKLVDLGIENPDTIIIRREIFQNGKNRIFINGFQDTINKLEQIGEWLIDIHGQHDHQLLLNQKFHLEILDNFGNLQDDKNNIKILYEEFLKLLDNLKALEIDEQKLQEERIFLETAYNEINNAKFEDNEEEELSEIIKKMENSEKLSNIFGSAYAVLYEQESSIIGKLNKVIISLKEIVHFDPKYKELSDILEDAYTKIDECTNLLADYKDELDYDENTLNETIERMELIKDLKRKYRKNSISELKLYANECHEKLLKLENRNEEISKLRNEIENKKKLIIEKSIQLSKKRQEVAKILSEKIKQELSYLGMEKAEFIVDIKYIKAEDNLFVINNIPVKINETGMDRVEFLISTNPGEDPKPLKKVASGGEISRIMLSLKSILSNSDEIETLIFDEIDVGIGGVTANNVGEKMKSLSENKQLIVISHLPQIACRANTHFTVNKIVKDNKTYTQIKLLNYEERVAEIARMLGGESEVSIAHAKELLEKNKSVN